MWSLQRSTGVAPAWNLEGLFTYSQGGGAEWEPGNAGVLRGFGDLAFLPDDLSSWGPQNRIRGLGWLI